jgi:hypothetical protein
MPQMQGNIILLTDKYVEVGGCGTNTGATRALNITPIFLSTKLSEHMK